MRKNPDAELQLLTEVNQTLRTEFLCVPPYNSIKVKWLVDLLQSADVENKKFAVTAEVAHPWRRAYQTTYYYRRLPIFKDIAYLLDVATIALLEGNWVCAYFTLFPSVEYVANKWAAEIGCKSNGIRGLIKSVSDDCLSKLDPSVRRYKFVREGVKFLSSVLNDDFFMRGSQYLDEKRENTFNRNIASHLLSDPCAFESGLNAIRVLLILDVIAEVYVFTNPHLHSPYASVFDLEFDTETVEKYFDLYKMCAHNSIYNSCVNRLHNTITYERPVIKTR